jgi:LETM1 and EF-hand domain-containing protein 1
VYPSNRYLTALTARTRFHNALSSDSTRQLALNHRAIPPQFRALAILIPQRRYSTEPSTSTGSGGSFPPPGFNTEQAKRPLPQESRKTTESAVPKDGAEHSTNNESKTLGQTVLPEHASAETAIAESERRLPEERKEKKLTIGQKIKKEVQHYWDGTKLLATEVKISMKLALKMAAGYELSRRESRQVCWFLCPILHG